MPGADTAVMMCFYGSPVNKALNGCPLFRKQNSVIRRKYSKYKESSGQIALSFFHIMISVSFTSGIPCKESKASTA